MKPELKSYRCATIDDLETWTPKDNDVVYWLEMALGPAASEVSDIPAENYLVCVATLSGLDSLQGQTIAPFCSRGPTLMLQEYSWAAVVQAIETQLESCEAATWEEVQERLARVFQWEHQGLRIVRGLS